LAVVRTSHILANSNLPLKTALYAKEAHLQFETWYIFLIAACLLNLYVSVIIAKRDDLEQFQKTFQIILVWLVPIITAIGLWAFHRSNDDQSIKSGPMGGGTNDNGDEPSSGI
jgi:hypothetical protein